MRKSTITICTMIGFAVATVLFALPAAALKHAGTPVGAVDEVYFNGANLQLAYEVESRCKAQDHTTTLDFNFEKTTSRTRKTVVSLTALVYDSATENQCSSRLGSVLIKTSLNLSKLVDEKLSELRDQGYDIDPDYTLILPPLRALLPDEGHIGDIPSTGGAVATPPTPDGGIKPPSSTGTKVNVVKVNYIPNWHCRVNKNDGSSRDGFDGYGKTMNDALQQSVSACSLTGDSNLCRTISSNPQHTFCDPGLGTEESVSEYDSNNLPAGAHTESYTCTLRKNDGARKDGFSGTAATEESARQKAADGCKSTNHPSCDSFSQDDAHTTCAPRIVVEGPKPTMNWTCTLYKYDGARKDGFQGSGASRDEAASNAASACSSTHHPQCNAFSIDPAHTQCTADYIYPDGGK